MEDIKKRMLSKIRTVPDFPQKGILFYDISTLLLDPEGLQDALNELEKGLARSEFDLLAGIESRGFIFGAALADRLGKGFVLIRKEGKLPGLTHKYTYGLEYGEDTIEICDGAVREGSKIALVDDLLATGGTARAAARLIEKCGGAVVHIQFLIELSELNGCKQLEGYSVSSVIKI
ncbi:MAG: adenine phosphoribosyltransferase [Candidatus Dadabacteria bacterium]|nr:MAG: adenine phosphoribosyltransferase [Candidatus Dadabacteria bacterium]